MEVRDTFDFASFFLFISLAVKIDTNRFFFVNFIFIFRLVFCFVALINVILYVRHT